MKSVVQSYFMLDSLMFKDAKKVKLLLTGERRKSRDLTQNVPLVTAVDITKIAPVPQIEMVE